MELRVRNFRGVDRADIDLSKSLVLLAGENGAGKTSIVQAAVAALTGETVPVSGLRKSAAGALVRVGSASAEVTLVAGDDTTVVQWPKAERSTTGAGRDVSPYAAGRSSIIDLDGKQRASVMIEYLKAEPTREDLAAALEKIVNQDGSPNGQAVEAVWKSIRSDGWDAACERAKGTGQKLKGRWEQVTGENYGSRKAEVWQPEGWDVDLLACSEDTLQADVTRLREFLEAAIAEQAVGNARRHDLEASAASVPILSKKVTDLDLERQKARAVVVEAENELNELPQPTSVLPTQNCPHCGKPVVVQGGRVERPRQNVPDQAEIDRRAAALSAKRVEVEALRREQARFDQAWRDAEQELRKAVADQATLSEMKPEQSGGPGEAGDVEKCRRDIHLAEQRLAAFRSQGEAARIHRSIADNQTIIEALSPDGVRLKRLVRMLREFNEKCLRPLCTAAGWGMVTLTQALDVEYDGRIYGLLSASEQYRVRVVLALAMARLDESPMVIFDAADILDRSGRNGLFRMVLKAGIKAIVAMTMHARDEAERVAANGKVSVYWLEGGIANSLGPVMQAAE